MSFLSKLKILQFIIREPRLLFGRTRYIFIISHMRSRSTVLAHILGTNHNISGYRELHISYKGRLSLLRMRVILFREFKFSLKSRYLLDKILHNYTITNKLINRVKPKVIFLLREPEATLKSILFMGAKLNLEQYEDPVKVLNYYCSRLKQMEVYSKSLEKGCFFVESDEFINNSSVTLNRLTEWLQLDVPLSTSYSIFRKTGKGGAGDPSPVITSGVLKNKESDYSDIIIPPEVLERAEAAYKHCKSVLLSNLN
ncbi:hypothetical protein NA63_1679 [Flavobacteriaceae bacterium MAR_2010_105]|nr:hypothetical protein NA63_1679 [Flavobacteriaceae bacterium MAR_2010_105]